MQAAAVAAMGFLQGAQAQSITSCGGPSDLLKIETLSISPDPVQRGKPLTITLTGTLGAALTGGSATADLDAKVVILGRTLVDRKVAGAYKFATEPGLPAGETSVVIGPVTLPSVPGTADVTGKVTLSDPKGAPIACINLDLHTPLLAAETPLPILDKATSALPALPSAEWKNCGKPGDHLKDIVVHGGDLSGDLDEDVSSMSVDVDLQIHVGMALTFKVEVPVMLSPGFPKGHIHFHGSKASEAGRTNPTPEPKVNGNIVLLDANKQEIACLDVDTAPAANATTLVI